MKRRGENVMLKQMYPFYAAFTANVIAQVLKPLIYYAMNKTWKWHLLLDSGNLPSSHTAMVSALLLAVGIVENSSSTIFAVTLVFFFIVTYDATNVRFYAGRNIQITQQLIRDFEALTQKNLENPVYLLKVKEVLGHKWIEVITGMILGFSVSLIFYFFIK